MNNSNKAVREAIYDGLNVLGSSDWAVDLQAAFAGDSSSGSSGADTVYINPDIWSSATVAVTGAPEIWEAVNGAR